MEPAVFKVQRFIEKEQSSLSLSPLELPNALISFLFY